jgi:hypothetical protein
MADLVKPTDGTAYPYEPPKPVDPTNCPTCLSGFQPTDPPYEEAIKIEYATKSA